MDDPTVAEQALLDKIKGGAVDAPDRTVVIKFPNPEAAKSFVSWLCEEGEQSFFDWDDYRAEEQDREPMIRMVYGFEAWRKQFPDAPEDELTVIVKDAPG